MDDDDWRRLGHLLQTHRTRLGLSKRAAAERAGFSEATWRQLEDGVRRLPGGMTATMSARPETVYAAAVAVGIDPPTALAMVGMTPVEPPPPGPTNDDQLTQLIRGISGELAAIREEMARLGAAVDRLSIDDSPPDRPDPSRSPVRRAPHGALRAAP